MVQKTNIISRFYLLSLLFLSPAASFAKDAFGKFTPDEYIALYKDEAIRQMKINGIPASITLAQGMVETDCGNSDLALHANNHFGIKCHENWNGETYSYDDDKAGECFRKYNSVYESYADHSTFLRMRPRYSFLFSLSITDYKGWANGLKKAGYATDPAYAKKLIEAIERFDLSQYDSVESTPAQDTLAPPTILIACTINDMLNDDDAQTVVVKDKVSRCDDAFSFHADVAAAAIDQSAQAAVFSVYENNLRSSAANAKTEFPNAVSLPEVIPECDTSQ